MKKLIKKLLFDLITGGLLISQTANVKVLAENPQKDNVVPSRQEAIALLQNICPHGEIIQDSNAQLGCSSCPSFTTDGSPENSFHTKENFVLTKVIYGTFTQPDTQEALIDFSGCEPHVYSYGGSVLVQNVNQEWQMIYYAKGIRSTKCLKFKPQDSNFVLVCEIGDASMGNIYNALNFLQIDSEKIKVTQLLSLFSNIGTGRLPFYENRIEDWNLAYFNNYDILNLLVDVRAAKSDTIPDGVGRNSHGFPLLDYNSHLPHPNFYHLQFSFDGQSFSPTPKSTELLEKIKNNSSFHKS